MRGAASSIATTRAGAAQLGHTPAVCRASYIHPRVLDGFAEGTLGELGRAVRRRVKAARLEVSALRAIEPIVAHYLARPARLRA